jgi:hypothetical protein
VTVAASKVIFSSRGAGESEALTRALLDLKARGLRAHCQDVVIGGWWLSEDEGERAKAVLRCGGCPVFAPCGEAARVRNERFGVWGGRDRTRRPRPSSSTLKEAARG